MRERFVRNGTTPRRAIGLALTFLALTAPASAARPAATKPAARPGAQDSVCAGSPLKRFGFWAGDWVVKDGGDAVIGTNRVTHALGGCAYHEHWASEKGEHGESFTTYDRLSDVWHQLYIGSGGYVLAMRGAFVGDTLVLSTTPHPSAVDHAAQVVERWRWEPLGTRRLRQRGEVSTDGGVTWKTTFLGLYERAAR
jgi:hypothetical protein